MNKPRKKRRFSSFNLREALSLIGKTQLKEWTFEVHPVPPSTHYQQTMTKLKGCFDLSLSEGAKALRVDMVLLESLEHFQELKTWKEATLQTDTLTGIVDYLVAPQGTIYQSPLLCVAEAKKDNFEKWMAQCLVEMYACHQFNNGIDIDIYGIVTNAINWEFYKLTPQNEAYKSLAYSETHLEEILGILHFLWNQCAANLKKSSRI
jgi:hypothetical protein